MKALIITGQNVQDHEFIYPYYRLKEAGYDVTVALKDKLPTQGILGTNIPCDNECDIISYEELGLEYDLLIIPGGAKAMEKLRQERLVLDFISKWNMSEKIIGVICHGAQLLISSIIMKPYTIAGYYSIKHDIQNSGAKYSKEVTQSHNIVSAAHYKDLGGWMAMLLSLRGMR